MNNTAFDGGASTGAPETKKKFDFKGGKIVNPSKKYATIEASVDAGSASADAIIMLSKKLALMRPMLKEMSILLSRCQSEAQRVALMNMTEEFYPFLEEGHHYPSSERTMMFVRTAEYFLERHPDFLEKFGRHLQEKQTLPLPTEPPRDEEGEPILWRDEEGRPGKHRQPGDTPPDFIKRHYAPWLGRGMTRATVRQLDPSLYKALANWLRDNEPPKDFDLPTLKERNDLWMERIASEGVRSDAGPSSFEDIRRLVRARQKRGMHTER